VIQIRQRLKEAQDRQKSYADAHMTDKSYEVRDQVFICIRPNKSTIWFGKGNKSTIWFSFVLGFRKLGVCNTTF
jgi:hypothetical protein